MDQKKFADLVARAEKDPQFLHNLVFKPEAVFGELSKDFDRKVLGSMIAQSPTEIIARTIGVVQYCGNTCTSSCDNTCGGSCGFTTNIVDLPAVAQTKPYFSRLGSAVAVCGNTCTSSCDNTCGGSCGFTTNLTDMGRFGGYYAQGFR